MERRDIKKLFLGSSGSLGIAMALYAGIWMILCEKTGMISWIGFAGCTTYFASGKKNLVGIKTAVFANISGVFWAMCSILLGRMWNWSYGTALLCAMISYVIIIQAKIKVFQFIPGVYIGCFSTFAAEGNWKAVLPAILLGVLLGWLTDITGIVLYQRGSRRKTNTKTESRLS